MIYELRTYIPHPGKMEALLARFRDHTRALFEKHGAGNVGYWTNTAAGPDGELWYMLAFKDDEQRQRAIAAFSSDPAWHKLRADTERDGPLIRDYTIRVLEPADFSAIR